MIVTGETRGRYDFVNSLPHGQLIMIAAGSLAAGYCLFHVVLILLKRKLTSENQLQRQLLLSKAKQEAAQLLADTDQRATDREQDQAEELQNQIHDRTQDLNALREDLDNQQQFADQEEARLKRKLKDIENLKAKAAKAEDACNAEKQQLHEVRVEVQDKLAAVVGTERERLLSSLSNDFTESRQLECTKHLKILADELNTSAMRLATRVLATIHSRYTPEFVWPKGINHVELKDRRAMEDIVAEDCSLLAELRELTEHVNIDVALNKDNEPTVVRLAGGYGIYKEAAKLALEEVVNRPSNWSNVKSVYEKHRLALEAHALKLGKLAVQELQVSGLHVEILKMIGSLNWRTSYRQNQFHHSLEVAKLSGILATELGVDADSAKRCGLLHDIGKSIDYRIEGSHAVISGDYADRFGESKLICDTVMSHHADLIVESPLAYVLRAADTLSGARPGARVNLEEGYQDRLSSIQDVVRAFPGVIKVEIMNGAREVHVEVNHKKVREDDLQSLSGAIARKIEENVAYPGQIKVMVARRFESVAVA